MPEANIHYTTINTASAFRALEPEWDALLEKSSAKNIFLSWTYLLTWLENAGTGVRLHVLIARDVSGRLLGIAPLCVVPGKSGMRRHLRHLTFLGGMFDSLAEYGDYIIEQGREEEIAAAFTRMVLSARELKWDLLHFQYARANSISMQTLRGELGRFGQPQFSEHPSWICGLTGTWENFLASRSSRIRQGIRYRDRKLEREHAIAFHHAGKDISFEDALEHLIRLNKMRWGQDGTAFHTDRFISFHRAFISRMAPAGGVSITLLQADGKYIAARYDFPWGGRVINFQIGWDPEWAAYSVSLVLMSLTVQHFMALGYTEYDFLAGDAKYKRDWHTRTEPLLTVEMPNPRSLRARAFFGLRRLKSFADSLRPTAPAPAAEPQAEPAAA